MIKAIFQGIKSYGSSFKLMSQLGLWKYFAVPILISLIVASSIGFISWGLSDDIGFYISKIWFWEWGSETFRSISNVLGGISVIALGLIVYRHTIMALSAPFMSPVSEKIEQHLLGNTHSHRDTSQISQLWRGIRINGRNLLFELLMTIPLLLISLIPVLNIISVVLMYVLQSYYAGFGNMDYTLERHFNYSESNKFVKRNRGTAIGNGMVFMALLLIPVIGIIIVLPLSVTASTTETIRLLNQRNTNER